MEVPDHNGVGYLRGPQGDSYRSRGQLQRHHTIQTCDDAYVSEISLLVSTDQDDLRTSHEKFCVVYASALRRQYTRRWLAPPPPNPLASRDVHLQKKSQGLLLVGFKFILSGI